MELVLSESSVYSLLNPDWVCDRWICTTKGQSIWFEVSPDRKATPEIAVDFFLTEKDKLETLDTLNELEKNYLCLLKKLLN